MKRKILFFTLALPFILLQNAQAQTSSRLVGQAHWINNGASFAPHDSSDYQYSGVRGGSINSNPTTFDAVSITPNPMKYDNSTNWQFAGDSAYKYYYYLHTFDANNNVTGTIFETYDAVAGAWVLSTNTFYTYNSSNMITSMMLQNWNSVSGSWIPSNKDIYSYNAAGMVYLDSSLTWSTLTSTWNSTGTKTYYYDGSLNLVNETDQTLSGGSPTYTNQWARTYSTTNQLLTTTYNTWSGSGWVANAKYTHAYDSSGNPISLLYQTYNTGSSAWVNNTLYIYSSFVSHLPQSAIRQTWNSTAPGTWVNSMMFTYAYNTYNQMTSTIGESWNVSGMYEFANGDPKDNYYYQAYSTSPTNVKSVTSNGGDANIYPVPAQNMLHIDLNWSIAQSADITIMDMTGRIVRQWNTPAATQYNSAVSVSNLPSGTYIVNINGQKGQIVKQIVVAR